MTHTTHSLEELSIKLQEHTSNTDMTDVQFIKMLKIIDHYTTTKINEAVKETEKAFGGCKNCYGKGYSTWRHGETYRGSTKNLRNDIKYCSCDRGQQLSQIRKEKVK